MHSPLRQTAVVRTIPAPIGGWNARDPLSAMKTTDAVTLQNFIPGTGGVSLRGGSQPWATGLIVSVRSLLRYNPPSGAAKLFGAAGTNIFDVSSKGPVGAAVQAGVGSDLFSHVNFGTPGSNFLVAVNGVDGVRTYDGSAWTLHPNTDYVTTIPGYTIDTTKWSAVATFAGRLFFVQKNSLVAWFLPVQQITAKPSSPTLQNTANPLDFGGLFRLGGSLVAIGDWTRDGGTGSDDYAVFVTSAGEVAIYQGTDPTNAAAWAEVGVFRIPTPIGPRCLLKAGADLAVLTVQGVIPLSQFLPLALSQASAVTITDKIKGAFADAYQSSGPLFGWEMAEYPRGQLVFVNVPFPDGSYQQFVMHVQTGAWCQFTGLQALCWALLGDNPMFGRADGSVWQFDVGTADGASGIAGLVLSAFQAFRNAQKKRFTLARPVYTGPRGIKLPLKLRLDYDTTVGLLPQPSTPQLGTPWDTGRWDVASWGPSTGTTARWQSIRGVGEVASVLLSVVSLNPITLQNIDVLFEVGGLL